MPETSKPIPVLVDEMETRMKRGIIDGVAKIIGRKRAEELAAPIYAGPPPAQDLSPYELSLLERTDNPE